MLLISWCWARETGLQTEAQHACFLYIIRPLQFAWPPRSTQQNDSAELPVPQCFHGYVLHRWGWNCSHRISGLVPSGVMQCTVYTLEYSRDEFTSTLFSLGISWTTTILLIIFWASHNLGSLSTIVLSSQSALNLLSFLNGNLYQAVLQGFLHKITCDYNCT